jgi:hypothetical protein
MGNREI